MIKLSFPPDNKHFYYPFYVSWIKNIFEYAGAETTIDSSLGFLAPAAYFIKINGNLAFIELSDFPDEYRYEFNKTGWVKLDKFYNPEALNCPVFKRSHRPGHIYAPNQYPLGPFYVSDNTSSETLKLLLSMGNVYNPYKAEKILWTNRIYAGAVLTRKPAIAKIDKNKLLPEVSLDTRRLNLREHFERHKNLLGSMNISGAHFTSVDIGPIESMFMGVCVLSNNIDLNLPFGEVLTADEHYLCLNKDYSNINEQLNYFYEHRDECKNIGDNAYKLMMDYCHPTKIVEWLVQKTEEYYE